ncbi:hypothetical protein O6H91_07G039800 [Diphasiastrum complanatum]|uniref:Uncharacterized protein n=1 Tax=Diphasiastrum complanatum TaxID=34168 RepID=A0ACC2D4E2_DIPCM|nr:hypothetical protein O6H91_07G039800 [Diphasiastrum complanatum]
MRMALEEWIGKGSVGIIGILLGAFLPIVWCFCMSRRIPKGVPPGSLGWPILGETLDFLACRRTGGVASFFQLRRKKHGEIFKTHIFFCPTIVIAGPEGQKMGLSDGYNSVEAGNFETLKDLFGRNSLFSVTSEQHKRMKRAILGSLQGKALRDRVQRVEKLTLDALKNWEGKEVIVLKETSQLTHNVILNLLLSMEAGQEAAQLRERFLLYSLGGKSLPIKLPGAPFYKALQARRELLKVVRGIIEQRKRSGKYYNDVLQSMLQIQESSNGLSEDEIVENIILLMFGGTDTTSTAITRIIEFLAENPDELTLLQEEHDRVGRNLQADQPLTWDVIKSMSYTYKVISEGLRLSRIADALPRTAVKDLHIQGYKIPKGWRIFVDKEATEFNPQIFDEPLRFKPSRFENPLPPLTFIPFGGGPRMCPGMELATLQIAIFLHHFVRKYRWRVKENLNELDFTRIVPQPKNGLPIFVELR